MKPALVRLLAVSSCVLLAGCAGLLVGCSKSSEGSERSGESTEADPEGQDDPEVVYPDEAWDTTTAADAGIDQAVLDDLATRAEAAGSNCLLVSRAGRIVGEWYWAGGPDSPQEVWSASKSFTGTFIGMAVDDGDLEVTDRASEYIPEWKGTPSEEVTVEHLLSNDSGRHYDAATDYGDMAARASDKTAFAIGLGQDAPPGEVWAYNNSAIQTLEAVFESSTGEDMAEFAQQRLFEPLGMADTSLERDQAGNPLAFMGIQSTCRDMARFGYLMLHDGEWDGESIVSKDWVRRSTDSSQKLNAGYGWLWWVNDHGPQAGDEIAVGEGAGRATRAGEPGNLVPGAPEDMFFAQGLGGQVVAVDPGTETVVVRLGPSTYPEGTQRFRSADAALVAKSLSGG
jgi:CubicO group peptidase (beta-lactamase class C family)